MSELYKEEMVWARLSERCAVRYTCLQDLETKRFAVHSKDYFYHPLEGTAHEFARQFVELMVEDGPRTRCRWFDSLQAAIAQHERDFG